MCVGACVDFSLERHCPPGLIHSISARLHQAIQVCRGRCHLAHVHNKAKDCWRLEACRRNRTRTLTDGRRPAMGGRPSAVSWCLGVDAEQAGTRVEHNKKTNTAGVGGVRRRGKRGQNAAEGRGREGTRTGASVLQLPDVLHLHCGRSAPTHQFQKPRLKLGINSTIGFCAMTLEFH